MFEILIDLIVSFWSPPPREDRSIVGESRLDREARVFGWVLLLIAVGIGFAVWFFRR